jgi:thiamine biosynthesis lipoprotein
VSAVEYTLEVPIGDEHDISFSAMGTQVRLIVGPPLRGGLAPAAEAAASARKWIEGFDCALSRFRSQSELSRMNRDPAPVVAASPLLRELVRAGITAAADTGGLVDPTMVNEIEEAGYASSRGRADRRTLEHALRWAPPRRRAMPDPRARWRRFIVDDEAGTVARDPGLRFDSGGIGKGLAADLVARRFEGYGRFLIDCGGDIRVGGPLARLAPYRVGVAHPFDHTLHRTIDVGVGAVATSGIDGRIWRHGAGFGHHLLDPASGRPAWTRIVSATALGPTAVQAETRAKAAVLSGPADAAAVLADGGLFVDEDWAACEIPSGAQTSASGGA